MDEQRLGRSIRALRQRLGWRQSDLARKCGTSQAAVSRLECGRFGGTPVVTLKRVVVGLGAELDIRIRWHGEELDRLLDATHAAMVERLIEILSPLGWECAAEVTFLVSGERGSIDILAWHRRTGRLLVVETKSVVPDMQQMLGSFDRKVRLGPTIAARRGWRANGVPMALVLAGTATNRRRAERFASTLRTLLPANGPAMRRWLKDPVGPCPAALWLLSDNHVITAVRRRRVRPKHRHNSTPLAGTCSSVEVTVADASRMPIHRPDGASTG